MDVLHRGRVVTGLVIAAAALAACGTAASTATSRVQGEAAKHGVEIIVASIHGAPVAAALSSSGSSNLSFPEAVFTGPVATTVRPFSLGAPGSARSVARTPAGDFVVDHASAKGFGPDSPGQIRWKDRKGTCFFTAVFDRGTFKVVTAQETGQFAGFRGSGVYALTAGGSMEGRHASCTSALLGTVKVAPAGAVITFEATGRLRK